MAFCSYCGTKLEDGAKFCPKCGQPLGGNTPQSPTPTEQAQDNQIDLKKEKSEGKDAELTKAQKWSLGIAGGIILTGIIGFSGDSNGVLIILIGAVMLAAILCVFYGKIHKKYAWWVFGAALVGMSCMGNLSDNEQNAEQKPHQVEQKKEIEESEAQRKEREQKEAEARQVKQQKEETERREQEQRRLETQKANKKKELEEKAYKAGYQAGFTVGPASYMTDDPKRSGRIYYTTIYGAPISDEEKELCKIFVKKYVEGYEEGHRNQ